jgi:hypothetical protein
MVITTIKGKQMVMILLGRSTVLVLVDWALPVRTLMNAFIVTSFARRPLASTATSAQSELPMNSAATQKQSLRQYSRHCSSFTNENFL